jgi:hypothetical protein
LRGIFEKINEDQIIVSLADAKIAIQASNFRNISPGDEVTIVFRLDNILLRSHSKDNMNVLRTKMKKPELLNVV